DDLPDVHQPQRRHGGAARRARRGSPAALHRKLSMSELIGLPKPPAVGASALPAGTFDGAVVFITGAGTGLGKAIAGEFARLGAAIVIASRKAEHLDAGRAAIEAIGARVA